MIRQSIQLTVQAYSQWTGLPLLLSCSVATQSGKVTFTSSWPHPHFPGGPLQGTTRYLSNQAGTCVQRHLTRDGAFEPAQPSPAHPHRPKSGAPSQDVFVVPDLDLPRL